MATDWLDINKLLNSYQQTLTSRATLGRQNPSQMAGFDPARHLLLNSRVNWQESPDTLLAKQDRGGPSVISRIFDILSRPRYAVSEATRQGIQPDEQEGGYYDFKDALSGAWQGLSGKRKTSWSDVIAEQEYNMRPEQFLPPGNPEDYKKLNPEYKGPDKLSNTAIEGFGLAGDLLLDPINFIGAGTIKAGINAGRSALGMAPKANALETSLRPGASISTQTFIRPESATPPPSLVPEGQQLPPGLAAPANRKNTSTPINPAPIQSTKTPEIASGKSLEWWQKANIVKILAERAKEAGVDVSEVNKIKENIHWPGNHPEIGDTLSEALARLDGPNFDAVDEFTKLTGMPVRRDELTIPDQFINPQLSTPSPAQKPKAPAFTPTSPGLASEAIISPAARILDEANNFPKVSIPETLAGTNKEIRDLIKEIASGAGVKAPVGIGKMNKADLTRTLNELREQVGKPALGNITKGPPLKGSTPKVNVAAASAKIANQNETNEALKIAKEYQDNVLSKPNKFPTPGRKPAVNNPAQQVNFFNNKVLPSVRNLYPNRSKKAQKTIALRMLKMAEDAFEANGFHPAFWSGVPFKLSEVIERMGGFSKIGDEHLTRIMTALGNEDASKIANPKLREVVEGLISEQKLKEIPYVNLALNRSLKQASVAEQAMSKARFDDFKNSIVKGQKNELTQPKQIYNLAPNVPLYITPKSVNAANSTLQEIFKNSIPLTQRAINSNAKTVQQYIRSNGTSFWAPVNRSITNAIHQTIGGPTPSELGTQLDKGDVAEHWLLSRISTAYGNKDLRPQVLINQQGARAKATIRAKALNAVAKGYTADEINEAFKVAQGGIAGSSERVDDLAGEFTKSLESLLDGTNLSNHVDSVAYRTGMLIKDINKQLKHMKAGFTFTNGKKVEDQYGTIHDFSKGNDWLKSWQTAKVDDPLVFMSKLQAAVENVVAKNSFLDDFASRWGSRHYDAANGFTHKLSDSRLKGLYYNKELAEQMNTVLKNWDQFYDPKSPVIRLFDQATSMWKTGMTIYMPSHHIRNMIGDVYLSWMDGVNTVKPYRIASKVMWSQRKRYEDMQKVEDLVSPKAITNALTRPGDNVLRTKAGVDVTADQIYTAAFNMGLLQSANVVEDIIAEVVPKIKPFGGRISKPVRGFAEGRDHYARLAHFIDIVSKSKNKNLEEVFNEAAQRVRKWHPDGMDLTEFERKYLRRIAPFYSWTRKSVPLIVESAILHPGKTMAYPKFMYGLQQMAGIETAGIGDPFPEDQLFPDWVKEKGIGPIGAHGMPGIPGEIASLSRSRKGFEGEPQGYTIANPSNPFIDFVGQYAGTGKPTDPVKGIAQMVNPFFRVPAEIGTGHTALGVPIDYDFDKYMQENIPIASLGPQLTNVAFMGTTERGKNEGLVNEEGLVNFFTALGLRGTGASIKQAEFEARERAKDGG